MKKIFKKNQVIITSLAILIAVAGYLNFADVDLGIGDKEASTDNSSILDQVEYDLSDETAVADENAETAAETAEVPDGSSTPGEAVLTGASDFAAQAKLSREQVRSQSKADLQEILNNTEVGDEQKQEAVNTMVQMTEISEKEAAAEIVPEAELEDAQRAQIEDIVKRKTGITPENIVITPLNEGNDEAATDTTSESDGEEKTDEQQTDTYKEQETSGEDIVTEGIYD